MDPKHAANTPAVPQYACPKCRTPLRLTLRTSWGAYFVCGPCDWRIYWTAPAAERTAAGAMRPPSPHDRRA